MQDSLICNLKTCNNFLQSLCQLFSCGHVVCSVHLESNGMHCPVCSLNCSCVQINLSHSSGPIPYTNLIGLSHKELITSFSCALEYWNFQQNILFNKLLSQKDQELNSLKSSISQLKSENQSLKFKLSSHEVPATPNIFSPPYNKKLSNH